jgi:putative ABC transport system permease protein
MNQLVERSHAIPGVTSSALVSSPPLLGPGYTTDYIAAGRPEDGYGTEVEHVIASPEYFATMKTRVIRGRALSAADRRGGPPVVVINETLARSYFAGQDPVGQRIAFDKVPTPQTTWYTIIGVVADQHLDDLQSKPRVAVIQSSLQEPPNNAWLLLRTSGDPASLVPAVRAIVHELDPTLAISTIQTMEQIRVASMALARFLTTLLLMFAAIGLLLAVVGVYGVLAQSSRNRTREMGIRIALGAQATQVRWLLIRQGLMLTTVGLAIGGATALVATRAMRKLLFAVAPNDPATLLSVIALLALTGLFASWLPAVRASRADPATALRSD